MKFSTSSLVLASLAISGTALAVPTPPLPFDSPVPNSPKPDDWTEHVRSPRVPRSPMVAALRVGGRRQSIPRFKRQDGSDPAPDAGDADTASAQGLLGGLGDALDGLLHQVEGVANGLPIVGGLGILSDDGSSDSSQPQKRQAPPSSPSLPTPPIPQPPIDQAQQAQAMAMLLRQQAQQQAATLGGNLPVNPLALQQELQVLQQQQLAGLPLIGSVLGGAGGLVSTVEGVAGGLPIVGGVLGPNGLVGGVVGDVLGPNGLVGGIVGPNGLVGGLLGNAQGDVSGLLGTTGVGNTVGGVVGGVTGTANNLLGGGLGSIPPVTSQSNIFGTVLGAGAGIPQVNSINSPLQAPHFPDPTGFYPHSLPVGPPVPPNSPVNPMALVSSMGNPAANLPSAPSLPVSPPTAVAASMLPVPPPSSLPTANAASVVPVPLPTSLLPTGAIPHPVSAPSPLPTLARRRVDGDSGEDSSQLPPDESADGFNPAMPDSDYAPPLLVQPKRRSACNGVPESALHEGGCDAVPGPQDALKKKSGTLPRPMKMFRRRLRGVSVSF